MRPCIVIPVYNHAGAIAATVASVQPLDLPVILIDDGSDADCARVLEDLADRLDLRLERLPVNRGKGAAMKRGLRVAAEAGFSHALQLDADGQHDPGAIPAFLDAAAARPDAMINGRAVYDASVPKARHYGRYITHFWVWVNTLSLSIPDSMCGLRLYPLARVIPLLDRARIGNRMEYDTEMLVRAYWAGIDIVNLPVRVRYPRDGISHFRLWRDNMRISWMHARLFFGMLPRIPSLVARHCR